MTDGSREDEIIGRLVVLEALVSNLLTRAGLPLPHGGAGLSPYDAFLAAQDRAGCNQGGKDSRRVGGRLLSDYARIPVDPDGKRPPEGQEDDRMKMPKNWRTTMAGVAGIVFVLAGAAKALLDSDPATVVDWPTVLAALGFGGGLIRAKDYSVTGVGR